MTSMQRLIVERAPALAKELGATAGSAPDGQVIDRRVSLPPGEGREPLRRALQSPPRARADVP